MCGLGSICWDCQCVAGTQCLFGSSTNMPICQTPPVQCAASVTAGSPCSGSAECDVSPKEVAVCVQGAWWVGTIAGKTTDTSKGCNPEGSWQLAYAPTATPCGAPLPPDAVQIRRVHNGYDRAVSFAGFASVSMPIDGCTLAAAGSVAVPGATANVVREVTLSFTGAPSGTLHMSSADACTPPESTTPISMAKL